MTPQVSHRAARPSVRLVVLLGLFLISPLAGAAKAVPLTDAVHEYGPELAPIDKTVQLALLDAGWLPLTVTEREITAETRVRDEYYLKVRIRIGDGKATFTHLQSEELGHKECGYMRDGKQFRGPCIEERYYEVFERFMKTLPLARARVAFLQSLVSPGGKKP